MEILYKRDSKGKILKWSASVGQNQSGVFIEMLSGEINGNPSITYRSNIKGKNQGKANNTSPKEQAEKDCISLYNRKKKQGYKSLKDLNYNFGNGLDLVESVDSFLARVLEIDTTDADGNLKPMKAQQYYRKATDKGKDTWTDPTGKEWADRKYYYLLNPYVEKENNAIIIKFPCIGQPKINGVRGTISLDDNNNVQVLSKEGLTYELSHVRQWFEENKEVFDYEGQSLIFDGEFYIYGESLQVISSAVKKTNLNTSRVIFICFDIILPKVSNKDRIGIIKTQLVPATQDLSAPVGIIKSVKILNDVHAQNKTDEYIEDGYEGMILRDFDGLYQPGKRPMTMVKLKRCISEEFKIVNVIPQDKDPQLGLFTCITKDGQEFQVTPKGDLDFKRIILIMKEDYIGKLLTCTFYEYTEKGIPFHVIENIVRDYE